MDKQELERELEELKEKYEKLLEEYAQLKALVLNSTLRTYDGKVYDEE